MLSDPKCYSNYHIWPYPTRDILFVLPLPFTAIGKNMYFLSIPILMKGLRSELLTLFLFPLVLSDLLRVSICFLCLFINELAIDHRTSLKSSTSMKQQAEYVWDNLFGQHPTLFCFYSWCCHCKCELLQQTADWTVEMEAQHGGSLMCHYGKIISLHTYTFDK